jgi:hypothetical protein
MGMQTDVSAASVSTSSSAVGYRTRVRGLVVSPGTANGSVVLKDGGSNGAALITIPTVANGEPFNVLIPANGILFETDVYAALSGANTAAVVFYG